ncbi:YhcN/YlaJ family sporulation lipoprotein [Cytobacillus solani]|uniref:YhcN/YlaJ family sporulation lipoprotein n=1 Tax=Cytobacillus solani TaxID=1637975 RepID=UPI0011518209|nr:YhcN/YlaJ family sporulation lipoprotein [Cytobacillus solani]
MLKYKWMITAALTAVFLTACGANNNGNDTALGNRDVTDPVRVNDGNRFNGTNDLNDRDPLLRVRNNPQNDNNDSPRMRVADKAADRIAAMPEVKDVNVIVTDDNAYVAAQLGEGVELTRVVERKIADQVKAVDQEIDDVYVSANPDFYDRMTSYSNDIRNGEPMEGLFEEFTESVRRMFPSNVNNQR